MGRTSTAKERLLKAARRCIWENSFESVSVDKLCQEAQINKGSFYHFFKSKKELLLAVIESDWQSIRQHLYDAAFSEEKDPALHVQRWFDLTYKWQKKIQEKTGHVYGCPFANIAYEIGPRDEEVRQKVDRIFSASLRYISKTIQAGIDQEILPNDTEAQQVAQSIYGFFQGVLLMAKSQNDPEVINQMSTAALKLLPARGSIVN